jgi:DNA-binding XRE family transcriptional regulator
MVCHQGISPGHVPGHRQCTIFGCVTNASLTAPEYPPGPADSPPTPADDGSTRPAQRWSTVIDGHKLQQLRCQVGLSQAKLADQAQVGTTTVARLERQHHARCRTWTLARIAAALGEPQDALRPGPATTPRARGLTSGRS